MSGVLRYGWGIKLWVFVKLLGLSYSKVFLQSVCLADSLSNVQCLLSQNYFRMVFLLLLIIINAYEWGIELWLVCCADGQSNV